MASPLKKRLPRELKNNLGKYLGMFLLLTLAIAFTSGFLVAASSIELIGANMRADYNIEDGHFATTFKAHDRSLKAVEELGCTVVEQFYYDSPLAFDGAADGTQARVFPNRGNCNQAVYAQGRAPEADGEIALDRVFCRNNNLNVGDTVNLAGRDMTLVGIMTLSDYSSLFQNNSSFIFNALSFTTAQVTQEAYDMIDQGSAIYSYAFFLNDRSMSLPDRTAFEEDMVKALTDKGEIVTDFVDRESNQAMVYALDDVSGDQMMWQILLGILIVIMAFVFVVLTDATIESESAVIGTLLASGWRTGELIRHYMTLPTVVGLAGAVLGNVIGYTLLVLPMQGLYYNSYSFPPYHTTFNPGVLVSTTIIPLVLLVAITFIGLVRRMHATPLQFLRREITHRSKRSSMPLPERLRFVTRFRLRVFVRNASHFATLFFGIMFGSLLLLFGLAMMPLMEHFAQESAKGVPAEHLYVLKAPIEIDVTDSQREAYAAAEELMLTEDVARIAPEHLVTLYVESATIKANDNAANTEENSPEAIAQAEKFATATLETPRRFGDESESVTVYGIQPDSRYWTDVDVAPGKACVGLGVQQKCGIELGKAHAFTDKYTGDAYDISFDETVGNTTTMSVYMTLDDFNALFDKDADYFSGYASDMPLALNSRYVATEITPEQMLAVAEQMQDSMGAMAQSLLYAVIPLFLILIYLLTKTVIDRSARAISYMKVFGYHDREISKLYIRSITVTVLVSLIACLPILVTVIDLLVKIMMSRYSGNLEIWIAPQTYAIEVLIGAATYAAVAFLHMRRIRRVPLALAMKVQE
uniref:ABC-type transport system, involved in lipoprotein release, permease component n=1 Tax=uncultured bacterium Contig1772 TaxID=1393512 RepID=W0FQ78_9BACT|nr:ABC-type transport system, involved in lipoprotein release, permease component [uncultured bacterium Contig1772]